MTTGRRARLPQRRAKVTRETKETRVELELTVDGSGVCDVQVGIGFLEHMLAQLARHSLMDLTVRSQGDLHVDAHHLVEDLGICLGRALNEALGERRGIRRMGSASVPLDEALALVAVDLSGRGYAVVDAAFSGERIGELPSDLIRHFLEAFAQEGRLTLHARVLAGVNDHHKAEALFKALAKALDEACQRDPRMKEAVPSTKGVL